MNVKEEYSKEVKTAYGSAPELRGVKFLSKAPPENTWVEDYLETDNFTFQVVVTSSGVEKVYYQPKGRQHESFEKSIPESP